MRVSSLLPAMIALSVSPSAWAGAVLSITGPGGDTSWRGNNYPSSFTAFNVEFWISVDEPWAAVGAGLMDLGGSYRFSIKGRTTHGDGLTAPNAGALTSNATLFGVAGILDPVSANIGYFDSGVQTDYPPGEYKLATLTIKNASTPANNGRVVPPGVYLLNIGNPGGGINVGNLAGQSIPTTIGPPLSVHVGIPEPATLLMVALGGAVATGRRRL